MPKMADNLTPLAIKKLNRKGLHFVGHVKGLALNISATGGRSWILRVVVGGKRRDIGLGAYSELSLDKARAAAIANRELIRQGIDPIEAKRQAQADLKAMQASFLSFEEAANQYIGAHEAGWKNTKHAAQWRNTLETYAFPVLGKLHVKDVALEHILKVVEPIWKDKTETASRLRGRMESILDWAKVRGYRTGDNPARWRGNLEALLPARNKVSKVEHLDALPWHDAPAFMKELRGEDYLGARALELCILTAVRSGEVRMATWNEINLERAEWVIPADRMKAGKEHRVPLSPAAVSLLQNLPRMEGTSLLFPSNKGTPLSDATMTAVIRRKGKDFTVHGFRSTFRDWAGETTAFPREVIEHALAHQLKDKAEAAYARGDMFTKRINLMNAWAEFLAKPVSKSENIVPIRVERHG